MAFSTLNGHLPASMHVALPWPEASGQRLRADAAASLGRLAAVFLKDFGRPLLITDSYRSFLEQVTTKAKKGKFAATPGTSNHGLGVAIDMASGINSDASSTHRWMEVNGPRFGWINPYWAENNNPADGQHEPWHWEYDPRLDRSTFAQAAPIAAPIPIPAFTSITPEDDMARLVKHPNGSLAIAGPGLDFTVLGKVSEAEAAQALGQVTGEVINLPNPQIWELAVANAARRRDQN